MNKSSEYVNHINFRQPPQVFMVNFLEYFKKFSRMRSDDMFRRTRSLMTPLDNAIFIFWAKTNLVIYFHTKYVLVVHWKLASNWKNLRLIGKLPAISFWSLTYKTQGFMVYILARLQLALYICCLHQSFRDTTRE